MGFNINDEYLQALLNGDRAFCRNFISNEISKGLTLIQIYEEVIKPSLYEVGELWEYNKISVATEHLASAVTESVLNELYKNIPLSSKNSKKVIVTCVEKELHQIGARMVSDIFEMNSWEVYYLGANTPTNELIEFAKIHKPNIIAISMSIYFHLPELERMLVQIREVFPDLLILTGGQAFRNGGSNILDKFNKIIYLSNLEELNMFIKEDGNNG